MKKLTVMLLVASLSLGGCASVSSDVGNNPTPVSPTVITVIEGVKAACGYQVATQTVISLVGQFQADGANFAAINNIISQVCAVLARFGGAAKVTTARVAGVKVVAVRAR